jgi:hypothetical protein
MVLIAWRKLYHAWPTPWETTCIFLHDIGHWGKDYLDDPEQKKAHWYLGSRVARRFFGHKGFMLVAGHCPKNSGVRKSRLYDPDKYSWIIAPVWWMVSNTFFEPKLIRKGSTRRESALIMKKAMRENAATGFEKTGHDIYLEQWGQHETVQLRNITKVKLEKHDD